MGTIIPDIIVDPKKKHDFLFFFDVVKGNPNGDPDANNMPRMDPETGIGFVTDVAIKRKVRDMIVRVKGEIEGFRIYVQTAGIALNDLLSEAHTALYGTGQPGEKEGAEKARPERRSDPAEMASRRAYMVHHFYDIRLFGSVMSTGDYPASQVHGPMQLSFAESLDPISVLDWAITRVAVTKKDPNRPEKKSEIGRKTLIPYGLYRGSGFFSPSWARSSGVTEEDLALFWSVFLEMWDNHHSAASGLQALWRLYVFSHENPLGNAPTTSLFNRIHAIRNPDVRFPRRREDYTISVEEEDMPKGVTLTKIER